MLPGILPTLGLKIFLLLVPIVLNLSAIYLEGLPSFSAVDYAVARKYYIFQFIVVFVFVSVLGAASSGSASGSGNAPVLTLAKDLAENPQQIADWIGTAVPQQVRSSAPALRSLASSHRLQDAMVPFIYLQHRRVPVSPEEVLLGVRLDFRWLRV